MFVNKLTREAVFFPRCGGFRSGGYRGKGRVRPALFGIQADLNDGLACCRRQQVLKLLRVFAALVMSSCRR